jgi:hypothetical protein
MEYSNAAREVVEAVKAIREADEGIWLDRAMVAIAQLFPMSAMAFALHRPEVWTRQRRQEVRSDTRPATRSGFFLEDWISGAEAAAGAEGTQIVRESHLATAVAQWAQALTTLGIAADALVARTAEREESPPLIAGAKHPRIVGAARVGILEGAIADISIEQVLVLDERTGNVDRKRSIFNLEPAALADQEQVAVALVNGSAETPVFLIFGQEDDHTVVGEVDHKLLPMKPETIRKCQGRLNDRLQACVPPVPMKWREAIQGSKRVWIACMLGRARGSAVRTSAGSYPYRSGETTHFATPELITAWQREPVDRDPERGLMVEEAAPEKKGPAPAVDDRSSEDGIEQRMALAALRASVDSFFQSPPNMPTSVRGRTVEDWEPVFGPILVHFGPAIEGVVATGLRCDDTALERLARGLRTVFRLSEQRSGPTWTIEAPRLVARLIGDRLMVDAYCTERWTSITTVGQPAFDSSIGRLPWVLAPEYRHPEVLGNKADLAHELSLRQIEGHSTFLHEQGLTTANIASSYAAVSLGLALGTAAREEASSGHKGRVAWAFLRGVWDELERWEDEPDLVNAFAALAGEKPSEFRTELQPRVAAIIGAYRSTGYFVDIPTQAEASMRRIAQQATG